jgi:putative nucleotidyltransferase with HDIG domain
MATRYVHRETRFREYPMERHIPTREEAFSLLREFTHSEALINHALAVEAVMLYLARKSGGDEEAWGAVGLVHDIDYERWPYEHCRKAPEILRSYGWSEEYVRAVVSHGWGLCADVEPVTTLEKTLYAIDELTGLVAACALVRPSKSVSDLTAQSVMKKWKQPSFAAGANREVIAKGAAMLGVPIEELITDTIAGMREVSSRIGL